MIFFGTKCFEGNTTGVAVLTGGNTILGGIATLAESATQSETTLSRDLKSFMKFISILAVSMGLIFFGLGFAIGTDVITNFVYAIGIIVANVPEGLPVTLTITLTAAARRLADKNVLVKNLQGIETLGSTSCICSDKTGTLTQNRMAPAHSYVSGKLYDCGISVDEWQQLNKRGETLPAIQYDTPDFRRFAEYMALCSEVVINPPTEEDIRKQIAKDLKLDSEKDVDPPMFESHKAEAKETYLRNTLLKDRGTSKGNPTEAGMLKFVAGLVDYEKVRRDSPKVFDVPFNSALKYSLMIREMSTGSGFSHYLLLMKGGIERIVARCDKMDVGGEVVEMTPERQRQIEQKNSEFASRGERVLGLAYLKLGTDKYPQGCQFIGEGENKNVPTKELVFFGLMSLYDPPRIGIEKAVDRCRNAGIKVIMVTGDQPDTAKAIAHQCHIITNPELEYNSLRAKGLDEAEADRLSNVSFG